MEKNKVTLITQILNVAGIDEPYRSKFKAWLSRQSMGHLIAYYVDLCVSSKKIGGKQR